MTESKLAALVALALPTASFSQAPAVDYSIAQPASGSWSYVAVPGGSEARFTDSTATIRLTIHCTKANRRVRAPSCRVPPRSVRYGERVSTCSRMSLSMPPRKIEMIAGGASFAPSR